MRLIDTHAHLCDPTLTPIVDDVLRRALQNHVVAVIAIGTDLASSQQSVALAQRHPLVFASVGIHPNECQHASATDWHAIKQLAAEPHVVALGETGLDRHWDFAPFNLQIEWFHRHIELSQQTGLPLVIHMRDCEEEMIETLSSTLGTTSQPGVMHSFTGTIAGAAMFLKMGLHISFAGMVTYPKSVELRKVATSIPQQRLLIETDAPYLSPHPHRSTRPNEPSLVIHTCQVLADARNETLLSLAEQTTANAIELFRLPLQ